MKRNYSQPRGQHVRPYGWRESSSTSQPDHTYDDDECDSPPPAKKLLRNLLENEVEKAVRALHDETPPSVRTKEYRASSLIPEFDPDSEECTVTAWLRKIDQLGEVHGWEPKMKSFYLQEKLRGQARKWYNRLEDYNYTWDEWKQMLMRAFPRHRDYGNMLEEMMQRKKLPTETMTKYYQDKVAMCFRCKLSDSASVSCIIRGLPLSLQPNARAFQCERPDELYEGFLCALDDYRPPNYDSRAQSKDNNRTTNDKKPTSINPEVDPCPRCKKTGHLLRNCTQPDLRNCFKCGKQGHIAPRCPTMTNTITPREGYGNGEVKEIKMVQNYNDIYKKIAKINGVYIKSYVDTGSQVNVLSTKVSELLALEVIPTNIFLKGFSGGQIASQGEVEFQLEVDRISLPCKAYITDFDMGEINLLIGQPVINSEGMALSVSNGTVTLNKEDHDDFTSKVDVVEECSRFKVVTTAKETLLPGSSIIKVRILGNHKDNDVVTSARHFELQGISYSLPATLLRGEEGYVKVFNAGPKDIVWQPGVVLARAESCTELQPPSQVTAAAVLGIACAKNSTSKSKPKRQLETIITPTNLRYSLVLPHSRVTHFRSLTSERRISNVGRAEKLPPYAVQMEPVVQYSQKDPLYDPSLDNIDDVVVDKNELYAQPKILHVQDQAYGPPYGSLPTAPLYSHEPHQHYYEAPEPIIEIIIKESNETLPAPPPQPVQKKKKEPVHVFYVKYSKDPHNKDKVVYEKPVPAITPPTNAEEDHHPEYVTVTPEPYHVPLQTTTLRAIIKPESEVYHSDSSVKITFGNEGNHGSHHYSDRREGSSHTEDHEETAPRPAIAYPQQPSNHPQLERSAPPKQQHQDIPSRPSHPSNQQAPQHYRQFAQHAQNRIQFQQPQIANEQQLPRQGPSVAPFRAQPHISRQNSFNSQPPPNSPFSNGLPGPPHFNNNGPNVPGPIGPVAGPGPAFPTGLPRPNNPPTFHPRPSSPPQFARPHFNGPPRPLPSFHSGPQRPFHQNQPFFDEAKYLQENYHTITTEQVEPPKDQLLPTRQHQGFNHARPSPSPTQPQFHENSRPQQLIPVNQQLPQQRPHQQFSDSNQGKPSFVSPSRTPFFNLKPSPPQIEDNRPPFQALHNQPPQQPFSFHQGPQPVRSQPSIQHSFSGPSAPLPSPIPQTQFLPQPSSPTIFNYQAQPSPAPEHQLHFQQNLPSASPHFHFSQGPSERPLFLQPQNPSERPQFQHSISPSERPQFQQPLGPSERPPLNFHDHQHNVAPFVPSGGQLVAAIPKYEQHITVNGPTAQPVYAGFSEPTPTASHSEQQFHQQQVTNQQQQQHISNQQQQINNQQQQISEQQLYDVEQEQVRLQLAANVQKQQEEIQKLQQQLLYAQQQHQQQQQQQNQQHQQVKQLEQSIKQQSQNNYNQQIQATSPRNQYSQERSQSPRPSYVSSTSSPYYQTTSRTVEIKPTTQKYVSSTINSINTTPEAKKEEKKKKPAVELPDEVPDDLRQQLLSSGILDNADISILDYDKVGDTPLDSLPPDQLANFFSAGGSQQLASSENRPIIVRPNGDRVQSRIDDEEEDDQELAASENVPSYVAPPPSKQAVEMKVVHFDPKTEEGQNIAKNYVKDDATQVDPVTLNDKKYNRYLPLKVSGNQFPLPDILKGRKVTSVVVLAPVETESLGGDHNRAERAAPTNLKGIKFIAGDSLQNVLKKPTKDNFEKWLDVEKKTATDLQSVVLLVTGNEDQENKEIYMYDIATGNVNKLSGDLSNAFVEAAENNSLSKDIEKLAIEGEGTPENFDEKIAEASENVPLLVDLSGLSLDQENNQVSISSGYSKTKLGRSLKRH